MGFVKRYPIFCVLLVLLLLLFGGGIYLAIGESSKLAEAKDRYDSNVRQIEQVSRGTVYENDGQEERVAPSLENREKLESRLLEVRRDLDSIRQNMVARTSTILTPPADEFTFLPRLQSFIARMKSDAAASNVKLQGDEAFGFAKYALQAEQPPIDLIPLLDRQRQVLQYILRQLMASGPEAVLSVERELVEGLPEGQTVRTRRDQNPDDDVFTIEELVTARSNEFIDTFAFRLVFTGRTNVLRDFLNRIAQFELPLIVRSIQVSAAGERDVPKVEEAKPAAENALFALFGGGDAAEPEEETAAVVEDDREPVITQTLSRFTVVIEFVEVDISSGNESGEAGS